MEQNMAMFNSRYDQFDYSKDRCATAPKIAVDSAMEDVYDEATSDDITELYTKRQLNEAMIRLFNESKWKDKYGVNVEEHNALVRQKEEEEKKRQEALDASTEVEDETQDEDAPTFFEEEKPRRKSQRKEKKVEKADMSELYYYFHDKLAEEIEASEVDILCTIVEFFGMNYSTVYEDILTIKHKILILNALKEKYGIEKSLGTRKGRLF